MATSGRLARKSATAAVSSAAGTFGASIDSMGLGCSPLTTVLCGDGELAAPEQCDDSNLARGDGCDKVDAVASPRLGLRPVGPPSMHLMLFMHLIFSFRCRSG
mgnify:CR=1 FL=1